MLPFPVPLDPDTMEIHEFGLDTPHGQPDAMATLTDPVEELDGWKALVADRLAGQPEIGTN